MALIVPGEPVLDADLKESRILWRYLDMPKFMDLIHTKTLHFTRGDQFADRFEGAFTKSIQQAISYSYSPTHIEFSYDEFKKRLRERVFLNCWHARSDDSMAMWSIHGRSPTSVAVLTSVARLRDAMRASRPQYKTFIRKVRYVKHWRDPPIKIRPYSNVFSYKLKAYDFEREVRVIIDRFHEEFDYETIDASMRVPISIERLLLKIVVAPDSPSWFLELVKGVASKYSIKVPIVRSKLATEPI